MKASDLMVAALEAEGVEYVLLAVAAPEALRTFAKEIMPAFA